MAGVEPHAIHGREAGVPQPDDVVQQCGRMIVGIRKAEMVPALVDETREQIGRADLVGLLLRERVPAIGSRSTGRRMLWVDQIRDEQRAAAV